jgi:hypothetical protein
MRWLLYNGFANNSIPYATSAWAAKVPISWIVAIQGALSEHNPFTHALLYLAGIDPFICPSAHIHLNPVGPGNEIAAVMNYDNTSLGDVHVRESIVVHHNGNHHSISAISCLWEPLIYPLLFPHGTLGWGVIGSQSDFDDDAMFDDA